MTPPATDTILPRYVKLQCASCQKVLGWREARDDTRWIRILCDECYEKEEDDER